MTEELRTAATMIARLRAWWAHLGYMRPRPWHTPDFVAWGIRPWRGAPFLIFVIDRRSKTLQSADHLSRCKECHDDQR